MDAPHCTRELKTNPLYSYLRSIGWTPGTYKTALGIRADEPDRISKNAAERGIVYPLADAGIDKIDVMDYWRKMPFDLDLEEREGNCTWCWKKSLRKHILNIQANPDSYEFPARMEEKYSMIRSDLCAKPRVFFRDERTARSLIALAKALPVQLGFDWDRPEDNEGCASSCEAIV